MSLFVDTSIWSLALRRDAPPDHVAVAVLREALLNGDTVVIAGVVLQELLQGFHGPKDQTRIIERLQLLPPLNPTRDTYIELHDLEYFACAMEGPDVCGQPLRECELGRCDQDIFAALQ